MEVWEISLEGRNISSVFVNITVEKNLIAERLFAI
jgi:hypothetical protein